MAQNDTLPKDIEACHVLIDQVNEINQSLASELQNAKHEIEELKRYIYGQRSERHTTDDSQLTLFGDASSDTIDNHSQAAEEKIEEEITYRRRKRQKADRFPENLPREVQVIDVPQDQRACLCCGEEMPVIDTDVRERLEFIPAKFLVYELHYRKRACGKCRGTVFVAEPPESHSGAASLTKGSRYGFGVTAQIILGKYADHLPLYRLEDVFARAGVVIPRSTQVDLLAAASDLLGPLCDEMKSRLIASDVIGMDDTPVRLQDASLPGKMRTARIWLARGRDAAPYNVFDFQISREHGHPERAGPAKFLKDFKGFVTVDAYGVNDGVYLGDGDIIASCCHAHVRRKFEAAKGNDPKRVAVALAFYRRLFDIEDACGEMTDEDRQRTRVEQSSPLMSNFKTWLDDQYADKQVLPKSAIGKAVRYAKNQWKPLSVFLTDGRLPIHNNDTERDLRRLTIGRKNWLFIGSEVAGEVSARLYTITASAHRHQLDLWAYLDDVLRRLASGKVDIKELLPDVWAQSHPGAIRTYRQTESLARAAQTKARRARRRKLENR